MTTARRSSSAALAAILILHLPFASVPARAQDAPAAPTSLSMAPAGRPIGLAEALASAVVQHPGLATASIDVEIAEARIRQAHAVKDFRLDVTATFFNQRREPLANQFFQQLETDTFGLSASLSKGLGTGGRIGLRLSNDYTRNLTRITPDEATPTLTVDQDVTTFAPVLAVTIFQPLLRGFGNNGALADIRRGRAARDVAQLQREATAAAVVRDLVMAYWELAYAAEVVVIQRQSLDLAKEQLRVVEASVGAGRLARSATAEVEVTVAQRQADLLSAERQVIVRGAALRRLAGIDVRDIPLVLSARDPLTVEIAPVEVQSALTAAFEAAPQIKAIRAQGAQAAIDVDVSENGLLPQLDLTASAGPSGNASNNADAYEQLGKFETFTVQGSLAFSTSIERSAAKGARDLARAQSRRVKMTEADMRGQIAEQVAATVAFLDNFAQQIDVLKKAETASQVNLDAEQARFSVGRTTNFEVLRRQEELARVRLNQARARADYLAQRATLQALTGEIFAAYAIKIAGVRR